MRNQARARRHARGHRSAPHRDGARGRSVSADRARHGHGAVLRAARRISPTAARSIATTSRRIPPALTRRWQRARAIAPDAAATARATGLRAGRRRALLRAVRRNAAHRHLLSRKASTSRRKAPTRSTPSSIAISPPAASAGPAWGRSRSPASPTPWAAARSAGSPISSPRIWAFSPTEIDRVRRFWNAPRMATREGLKAVQMFEAIERGEIKALWVMATNPAVSLPRAGAMREALGKLELFVVSENVHVQRYRERGRARAAARRRLGREGRHRHQFRAPHLAPARVPAAARRSQARLVDRRRGRAAHGLCRGVFVSIARPMCSASMRRCRRSRTTARAISISAAWRRFT